MSYKRDVGNHKQFIPDYSISLQPGSEQADAIALNQKHWSSARQFNIYISYTIQFIFLFFSHCFFWVKCKPSKVKSLSASEITM